MTFCDRVGSSSGCVDGYVLFLNFNHWPEIIIECSCILNIIEHCEHIFELLYF